MGAPEITRFLTWLVVDGGVAGSHPQAGADRHQEAMRVQHRHDLGRGAGWVELPTALARKYGCGPGLALAVGVPGPPAYVEPQMR
jgi:hypothetical protein